MILLTSTSDVINVTTGTAVTSVKVHASWVDNLAGVITPGRTNTASITGAGTTTVVASPAASTQRNAKFLSVRNDDASLSTLVTITHYDGTNSEPLWKGTLLAGESVNFNEGVGWQLLDANGTVKPATSKFEAYKRVATQSVHATAGTFADVTDLTVPLKGNKAYIFEAHLFYSTDATTTGAQFGVNIGAAPTTLIAGNIAGVTNSVTAGAISLGTATARDTAITAQTTGTGTTPTMAIISGFIIPSADGTFAIRATSEVTVANGLLIRVGSWLHVREVDN